MTREFVHARTGRSIFVNEGSRTERLVEGDDNWSEVSSEEAPAKKAAARKPAAKRAASKPAPKQD